MVIETKDKEGKGTAKVTATRKNYKGPIKLTFGKVDGVEFGDATIKKDEDSASVDVTVSKKAKAMEHKVKVSGEGGKASHETELSLTIKEKGTAEKPKKEAKITLTAPAESVAIKLDKDKKGKGKATISAKREGDVDAIELKFAKTKGVTIKDATIKKGEDSVDVEVAVDAVEPGDLEIVVTGTGGDATADTKLKLKITK